MTQLRALEILNHLDDETISEENKGKAIYLCCRMAVEESLSKKALIKTCLWLFARCFTVEWR